MTYREPRRLDQAVARVVERVAPATTLARVQQCWELAAGATIASEATAGFGAFRRGHGRLPLGGLGATSWSSCLRVWSRL